MTLFITEKQVEEILSVEKTVELLEDAMKSLSTGKGFNSPDRKSVV